MKRKGGEEPDTSSSLLHSRGGKLRREEKTHDPSQFCYIDHLPDEVLASIFRLLPWKERIAIVEQVSKRWRRVALESGWKDFNVFDAREWTVPHGRTLRNRLLPPKVQLKFTVLYLTQSHRQ